MLCIAPAVLADLGVCGALTRHATVASACVERRVATACVKRKRGVRASSPSVERVRQAQAGCACIEPRLGALASSGSGVRVRRAQAWRWWESEYGVRSARSFWLARRVTWYIRDTAGHFETMLALCRTQNVRGGLVYSPMECRQGLVLALGFAARTRVS